MVKGSRIKFPLADIGGWMLIGGQPWRVCRNEDEACNCADGMVNGFNLPSTLCRWAAICPAIEVESIGVILVKVHEEAGDDAGNVRISYASPNHIVIGLYNNKSQRRRRPPLLVVG